MLLPIIKQINVLHCYSYGKAFQNASTRFYNFRRIPAANHHMSQALSMRYCESNNNFNHLTFKASICNVASNKSVGLTSYSWIKTHKRDIYLSSFYNNSKSEKDFKKMKEKDQKRMKRLVIFLSTCFILWMAGIGLHILLLPSQVFGYDELAFLPTFLPSEDFIDKILPTGEVEKIVIEAQSAYVHVYTQTGLKIFKLDIGQDHTETEINLQNVEKGLRDEETNLNIHPHHRIPIEYR